MANETKEHVGIKSPAIYFCLEGKRVGYIPIFYLERYYKSGMAGSRDKDADWFSFTSKTIPAVKETRDRFLQYLKKTFTWDIICNLIQLDDYNSELGFIKHLWQQPACSAQAACEFDTLRPPRKIYRYCRYDKDRLNKLFTQNLLHFNYPGKFNDPFDCNFNDNIRLNLDQVGICCFAAHHDSILMYSHYAERHTGLCLEFDANLLDQLQSESDEKLRGDIRPVFYFDVLPQPQFKLDEDLALIATTKSKVWAYEREHRLFCLSDKRKPSSPGLYQINPTALTGVIFGCEMSFDKMREIRMLTRNRTAFSYVRAIRKPDRFGLDFQDVTYIT